MKNRLIAKRYWKEKSTAMGQSCVMAASGADVINLSLGDPNINTDARIIEAAFADAMAGYTRYSDFQGDPKLRQAIARYYEEEFNLAVADEEIFVCSSATVGMYLALEAILDDGDEVILQAPFFTPYPDQVLLARGVPVELATYAEEDFQISMERLAGLITERTKALVINTPSNPTGSCLSLPTLEAIARMACKHDLVVIADDIYTDLSYAEKFIPIMSLEGMRERTITLNSFSKNFNMTGWRVGNIIAPPDIIRVIQRINENVVFTTPTISQRAGIYALEHRKELQPQFLAEMKERVFKAAKRFGRIKNMRVCYPPKGTFYLFVDISATGLSSAEAAQAILQEAAVLVLPGTDFGACGEGYIRIACTVGEDKLFEAAERLERMEIFGGKK